MRVIGKEGLERNQGKHILFDLIKRRNDGLMPVWYGGYIGFTAETKENGDFVDTPTFYRKDGGIRLYTIQNGDIVDIKDAAGRHREYEVRL